MVAWSGIHNALAFGLDSTLHQDPRYFRSTDTGFWRRSAHALRGTLLTRTDAGGETFSTWRIGSDYGSAFLSNMWYPQRLNTARLGFIQGSVTLGFDAGRQSGVGVLAGYQAKGAPQKMTTQRGVRLAAAILGLSVVLSCQNAYAYSVLTHEAIVDSTWDSAIKPLLLKRFPTATPDDLTAAHAYAYGGCIIQDLGYYPFGSKFFSDLTHYVRSGDFISNMIRESQDLDEYAFALGALAHFAADNNGHRMATNLSVPLLYPKLRQKFGNSVTYADDPFSHSKTEFAFDVFQSAKSRYASAAYKSFIGFQVAKPVLQRAFEDTYGMKIEHVFLSLDLAIGSYRRAVGTILPALTKVAWQIKSQEIRKEVPGITRKKFLYNLSRSSYEKNWGRTYERPGIRSRMLAGFFHIVPRVGPFKALAFEKLTPETERLYMAGFNASIDRYRELLAEVGRGKFHLRQ